MKLLLPLLILTSCSSYVGTLHGRLYNVKFGGLFFQSCEVTLKSDPFAKQYHFVSGKDEKLCDILRHNIGGDVIVKYKSAGADVTINSNKLIDNVLVRVPVQTAVPNEPNQEEDGGTI